MAETVQSLCALARLDQGKRLPIQTLVKRLLVLGQISGDSSGVAINLVNLSLLIVAFGQGALDLGMPGPDNLNVLKLVSMPGFKENLVTQIDHLRVLFQLHVTENGVHEG